MKTKYLRRTTLISLLGLSTAQTSTWGEPFSVDNSAEPAAPSSTENLLPSASSVASSIVVTDLTNTPSGRPSASASVSGSDSSFTVSLASTTESGLTVSTRIPTGTESETGTGTGTAGGSAETSVPDSNSTGAAAKPTGQPYVRMGVVGVIAGAAGVLF